MPDLQAKITDKFEKFSVYYHNLFDYPLSFSELIKWTPATLPDRYNSHSEVVCDKGYCFVAGKDGLPYKRAIRKRISAKKLIVARKAAKLVSHIPGIKMVAVTGSLAMENSVVGSDIDLFIITAKSKLWLSRLISYLLLKLFGFSVRVPRDVVQKDKLCLNMWFDEGDLVWREPRNIYTAHEIAQITPLINKDKTYEKFMFKNKWILAYWPNAVRINNFKFKIDNSSRGAGIIEKLVFSLQYLHMKSKITREVITPSRAIFHPKDWSKTVLKRLTP
jgi:predicted nucleotidyltransferase